MPDRLRLALRTLLVLPALLLRPSGVGLQAPEAGAEEPAPPPRRARIRLAETPALSPDGGLLAFGWRGDLWLAPSTGGGARRLTAHPALDRRPRFSPDGTRLAFTSNRSGVDQVYVLALGGGEPVAVTRHGEGARLEDWFPDGQRLLVLGRRDHEHEHPERFLSVPASPGGSETLLFDAHGADGALSPDGRRLAFVRGGQPWTRKGYRGSAAARVWVADLESGAFTPVTRGTHEERWPLFTPEGSGLWLVSEEDGTKNLVSVDLAHGSRACLTALTDDGVTFPTASRDGRVVVFRRLGDLLRFEPGSGRPPEALELWPEGEGGGEPLRREELTRATQAAFSGDGREVAFAAGGDLWVMDTELREPRRVTDTPEEERDPVFTPDGSALLFVSDAGGRTDLWRADRSQPERWWWQQSAFRLARLTDDEAVEAAPQATPDGSTLVYVRLPGDLWKRPLAGGEPVRLVAGFDAPEAVLSPDGRWVAYVQPDADFNHDVWILPLDLSRPPFNVSRHPDNESGPVWSPDGRMLAFTGRRWQEQTDVCTVWLRESDDRRDARDRRLEKAVEKMKGRKEKPAPPAAGRAPQAPGTPEPGRPAPSGGEPAAEAPSPGRPGPEAGAPAKTATPVEVRIDFEGLEERLRRIELPDVTESDLVFSPDGKRLAFRATVKGQAGLHVVEPPDELTPKLLTSALLGAPRWLKEGDALVGLVDGVPTSVAAAGGKVTPLPFRARRQVDVAALHEAVLGRAWAVMRDAWYDPALNGRSWPAVRAKYAPLARDALLPHELDGVVDALLGELNGSHLGFAVQAPPPAAGGWRETTLHLGLRLAPPGAGPGRLVRDVLRGGPAAAPASRLEAGERLLALDGQALAPDADLEALLTGEPDREVELKVAGRDGTERAVVLRPVAYAAVRGLLYDEALRGARERVERLSAGRLGYLHVRSMNWSSFQRFEEDLYRVGHGKEGLVIDVRGNGGGFTADHLLTCLTQPRHATTVPRDGPPGYPNDRLVYAAWSRPITVLIDSGSFSNAEIFAHAVRTLRRGRLVGTTTAGGVISTGGMQVMGLGFLRLPSRGWFLPDGRDLERLGCPPDVEVTELPGDHAQGLDRALEAAVRVLLEDVEAERARPRAPLRYASGGEAGVPAR